MSARQSERLAAETEEQEARLTMMSARQSERWIQVQRDLLIHQRSEPTGFNIEEKERNRDMLQRQLKIEKRGRESV